MTPCDAMSYCMLLYCSHPCALVSYNGGTNVGHVLVRTLFLSLILFLVPAQNIDHGPITTLFLGLILCLAPMTPCDTMLYWPSPNQLVATQSTRCTVELAIESNWLLWGAVRNRQLYIFHMYCKSCISFNFQFFVEIVYRLTAKKNYTHLPEKNYTT